METEIKQPARYDAATTVKVARHVTWVGFWINALLGTLKIIAGIVGRSSAMIADGVHSLSDFVTDIIVIIFVGISRKKADDKYQYGHGKYETFATMLLAMILAIVAAIFMVDGIEQTYAAFHGKHLERPTWPALAMAVVSIGAKEWLFHYTRRAGERIDSPIVIANAWHHRSDALSSAATLVGIAGAMFLGEKWRLLDPIAAIIVSLFILLVSYQIVRPAIRELLEASLPMETKEIMYRIIGTTPGIEAFHHFACRRNGDKILTDFHIKVNPEMTVEHAHHIASEVERRLRRRFGDNLISTIHIEPYHGQPVDENRMCR